MMKTVNKSPNHNLHFIHAYTCHRILEPLSFYLLVSCSTQDLLVVACEICFLDQGLNLGPLHWEHRVSAIGPPGKFQVLPS